LVSFLLTACQALQKGSGKLKTEAFNFNDFSAVEVNGPIRVNTSYADAYNVNLTVDDNIFSDIEISKEDNTLKVSLKKSSFFGIRKTRYVDAVADLDIIMPQLRSLTLSGTAEGTISGFNSRASMDFELSGASTLELKGISAGDMSFNISGASTVSGDIVAGDITYKVSGASTVHLDGTVSNVTCDASGANQIKLDELKAVNADIRLSGASTATINLTGKLDVNLSGDSDLFYFGNPVMGNTKISGGSTMSRK